MLAAYHGRADTVALLLARGADPDLRNHRDQTPIAGALFKGEDAIVAQLKDADADLDAGTPSAHDAARMFGRAL
jgi:ankyrin repeat protein